MLEQERQPSNGKIWAVVVATVLVTDCAGALLFGGGDHTTAYVAGELFVPLVIVGVVVGGLAMRGPSWKLSSVVPLVAFGGLGLSWALSWLPGAENSDRESHRRELRPLEWHGRRPLRSR